MTASTSLSQSGNGQPTRGCYVYGVVPADVEVTDAARGIGDPPASVRLVRHDDIAALVSEISVEGPLGRPEDLVAHEQLLDATVTVAPVLPMRFGAVMASPEAVEDELLAPHQDQFRAALEELDGLAEFVVKGRYDQQALLSEILDEIPEAARLREEIRGTDEDATRPQRIRLGEIINQAVTVRRDADTQYVVEVLEPLCEATVVRDPTHEEDAAHVALLVRMEEQPELERALEELAGEWEGRVNLRLLGPLAPYDFMTGRGGG